MNNGARHIAQVARKPLTPNTQTVTPLEEATEHRQDDVITLIKELM
ncbi:MAG: hypothetical protein HOE48_07635 [Candidatus Latescibacteria bacterium]|nr:hypothetical protein [Candidatus Latescibacterota bacterium]MBT4137769.1 hypothetical protein [Candidatus Latescibacterota bacterium]MBT5830140.1 hypothetical protein [Candidatus Latescibacterota bacterium]